MKTNSKIIAVMMLALFMASCSSKDDRMLTIINADGTCSREYTFRTTQQWLGIPPEEDYDSIVDKTWERTWSIIGADSVRYPVPLTEAQLDAMQEQDLSKPLGNMLMVHAKKNYKSVGEMSAEIFRSEDYHLKRAEDIKANSKLEKRFRWFYTDYTFTETFAYSDSTLFPIPLSEYLSADTASFWFTGQPDLTRGLTGSEQKDILDGIEEKVEKWTNANWFTEIYKAIAENYDSIQNPPVSKEEFVRKCKVLVKQPEQMKLLPEHYGTKEGIGTVFREYFQTDVYDQFIESHDGMLDLYFQLFSFAPSYDLVMPGTVTDAGMGEYDGKVIHYRLSGGRMIPGVYTITATSRKVNVWPCVASCLIIILAIGSFLYRRRK